MKYTYHEKQLKYSFLLTMVKEDNALFLFSVVEFIDQ